MIKLTKNELRKQQVCLSQFTRYLPTLQLKKSMLQVEVGNVRLEMIDVEGRLQKAVFEMEPFSSVFEEKVMYDLTELIQVSHVKKRYENIAGVDIPILEEVVFWNSSSYNLLMTPFSFEKILSKAENMVSLREERKIVLEKKRALERELQDVSIRVNLFEKVLIPRSRDNIRKIRTFLSDQQLAAVAQAKMAKKKIALRQQELIS
jgi:V/A-type H+-transporting ATPase subunit D